MSESDDFLRRHRKQTATVWETNGVDSAGDPAFKSNSPRTIKVRWEDKRQTIFNDAGAELISFATVTIGEDFKEGDWLYLGTSTALTPFSVTGAYRIQRIDKIPSVTGKKFLRRALL